MTARDLANCRDLLGPQIPVDEFEDMLTAASRPPEIADDSAEDGLVESLTSMITELIRPIQDEQERQRRLQRRMLRRLRYLER